ncbi:MAG: L-rhamnose mutarotase [Chloroflexi bacterium]|nr:MAG: L-rhamnose mutarotase [Chloroflexota bacterium]
MQSYGMTLMLKDDEEIVERYREYHRKAWPEVVSRLRENGITQMRIYLLSRRMFMYMEAVDGFSPERDFPKLAQDPRYREWDQLMRGLQQPAPEARAGEWWAPMEEVFDLSRQ